MKRLLSCGCLVLANFFDCTDYVDYGDFAGFVDCVDYTEFVDFHLFLLPLDDRNYAAVRVNHRLVGCKEERGN